MLKVSNNVPTSKPKLLFCSIKDVWWSILNIPPTPTCNFFPKPINLFPLSKPACLENTPIVLASNFLPNLCI